MRLDRNKISLLILRFGLAFSFIYAAIAGFMDPNSWVGYFPQFMQNLVNSYTLLTVWGVLEIILAFWIISGYKIHIASLIATVLLAGLIFANLNQMDVLFRDITILAVALAFTIRDWPKKIQTEIT